MSGTGERAEAPGAAAPSEPVGPPQDTTTSWGGLVPSRLA